MTLELTQKEAETLAACPTIVEDTDLDWRNVFNIEVARPRGGYDDQPPSTCFTGDWIMENKLDGERKTLQFGVYKSWLVSRNRHDKTKGVAASSAKPFVATCEDVPWLTKDVRRLDLAGTMLDGELSVDTRVHKVVGATMVGHLAVAAPEKLKFMAFDILFFRGWDVRGLPWEERRKFLLRVVKELDHDKIEATKVWPADKEQAMAWFEAGAEGVVLKPRSTPYVKNRGSKWWKFKASITTDAFVMSMTEAKSGGSPKNGIKPMLNGKLATLFVGMMRDGEAVRVAAVNHLPEDVQALGVDRGKTLVGRVVEFKASGFDGRWFGWARFERFRDDKGPKDCDWYEQTGKMKVQTAEGADA